MSDRVDAPTNAPERPMLEAWLEYHRQTLLMKCEGLDDDQLRRRSVPPSPLSLLGLLRHMTDVERGWFQRGVAGKTVPPLYYSEENPEGDFEDVDTGDVAATFAEFRRACDESRASAAAAELDDTFTRRDEEFSLRWVYVHMIEEYARHNGHADFLRETIDGATGD